jgi:permuted papain-like amidase YaeF/Yiix C92 family enzyme
VPSRSYWLVLNPGVFTLIIALTVYQCAPMNAHGKLPTPDGTRSGDVVFLQGKTIRSVVVRLFEDSKRDYSHVGIIVIESGGAFIIHANPGDDSRTDRVIKEPWGAVISSRRITEAAIFRSAHAPTSRMVGAVVAAVAQQFERDAVPFDHDFNLTTPQKLYCTELVWRAYMAAGIDLRGDSFGSDRKYLLPSDLIRSGLLREVPMARKQEVPGACPEIQAVPLQRRAP